MGAVEGGEVAGGERPVAGGEGDPVLAGDDGGHALAEQRQRHRRVEDGGVGVAVRVDQPGQHQPARDVDDDVGPGRVPVDDAAVSQQEVARALPVGVDEGAAAQGREDRRGPRRHAGPVVRSRAMAT